MGRSESGLATPLTGSRRVVYSTVMWLSLNAETEPTEESFGSEHYIFVSNTNFWYRCTPDLRVLVSPSDERASAAVSQGTAEDAGDGQSPFFPASFSLGR